MTSLTICRACQKPLAIPPDTHETATVQCPLCEEEFKLTDAVPDDVPTLAVIDPGTPDIAPVAGETTEEGDFQFDLGQFQPSSGESEDTAVKEGEAKEGAEKEDGEKDDGDKEDGDKEDGDEFSLVADEPVPDGAAFDFGAAEGAGAFDDGGAEAATAMATATAKAPKKAAKRFGWKTNVAGIVIFGMIGLALGYGILKIIKPEAAAPIDKKLAAAWDSVSSLWASDKDTSTEGGETQTDSENGSTTEDGGDDFVIGGMLPSGNTPKPTDIGKVGSNGKRPRNKNKKGKDDDTFSPTPIDVDPFEEPPEPTPTTPAPFASLLLGQPDAAGVIESVDADQLMAKLDKARTDAADGKLTPGLYFEMCKLGHLVAFAQGEPSSQGRTESEYLARQVAESQVRGKLSGFSSQMLFSDKRPKDVRGIFLVGKVLLVVPLGDLHATEIEVGKEDDARRVIVLTEERPDVSVHDVAGVLGSVVRDPQSKLPGYDPQDEALKRSEADNTLVILGGVATRLPKD